MSAVPAESCQAPEDRMWGQGSCWDPCWTAEPAPGRGRDQLPLGGLWGPHTPPIKLLRCPEPSPQPLLTQHHEFPPTGHPWLPTLSRSAARWAHRPCLGLGPAPRPRMGQCVNIPLGRDLQIGVVFCFTFPVFIKSCFSHVLCGYVGLQFLPRIPEQWLAGCGERLGRL